VTASFLSKRSIIARQAGSSPSGATITSVPAPAFATTDPFSASRSIPLRFWETCSIKAASVSAGTFFAGTSSTIVSRGPASRRSRRVSAWSTWGFWPASSTLAEAASWSATPPSLGRAAFRASTTVSGSSERSVRRTRMVPARASAGSPSSIRARAAAFSKGTTDSVSSPGARTQASPFSASRRLVVAQSDRGSAAAGRGSAAGCCPVAVVGCGDAGADGHASTSYTSSRRSPFGGRTLKSCTANGLRPPIFDRLPLVLRREHDRIAVERKNDGPQALRMGFASNGKARNGAAQR